MKAIWFENKELITLYTNPAYFGADVPDSYMQRPCKPVPVASLFGYEPESKMDDIHHKNDVLKLALKMSTGEYNGPPIVCRKHPKGLQVLDGHHRMQAARRAGVDKLDAVIVDSEDIQYSDAVREQVEEGWSDKYKKSINCSNPKGFSQKAHCAGRKKKAKEDVNEASGYIPTKAQENDPRFKTALTVDVRPGAIQRNIKALALDTNLDLINKTKPNKKRKKTLAESLMEQYQMFKEEDLVEVEMSSSALRSWAKSDLSKGVRAGFELELIFADTERDDEEETDEPNYDYDRQISDSLDAIVDFYDGENYAWESTQPLDEEDFRNQIIEDLMDYINAKTYDYMNEYAYNDIKEKLEGDEDFEELDDDAQEEFIDNIIEEQGDLWQQVFEEKEEEYRQDTSWREYFDEKNIAYMSDLMNSYDLDWPYKMGIMGGSLPIGSWAEEIANLTGKEVDVSYTYHGQEKAEGNYTIEPDSSLTPDESEDSGYELVSPVMPLDEAISELEKIMNWVETQDGAVYTNSSTGLHMNISVPQGNKIDYTKLVLFSGDKYILDQYSRFGNQYAESALEQIETRAKRLEPGQAYQAMQKMKTNLEDAAEEFVRGSTGQSKYTSIHIKDGYIEFRGPGGQYTSQEVDAVMDTMLRFARAMTIAADPDAYRKEYQKKLYKIISKGQEKQDTRTVDSLFADLQAGTINSEVFKKRWANLVVQQKQNQQILNKLDGVPDDKRIQKARAIQQSTAGRPKPFKYNLPLENAEGDRIPLKGKVKAASAQLAKQAAVDETLERLKDPNLKQYKPRYQDLKVEIDLEDPSNFVRYAYAIPYQDTRSPGEDKIYNNFIDVPKDLDMPSVRGRAVRHASENFFEPNADFTIAQTVQMDVEPVQLQPDYKNLASPAQPQDGDEGVTYTVTIPYEAGGKKDEHSVVITASSPEAAKQQGIQQAKRTVFRNSNFTPKYEQTTVSSDLGQVVTRDDEEDEDARGNYKVLIPYEDAQGRQETYDVTFAADGPEAAKQEAIEFAKGGFFMDFPRLTPNYQETDVMSMDAAWMR